MGAAFPVLLGSHGCFEARTTGSSNTCTDPWRDGIPCAPRPPLSPWSCSPVPFSHPCDLPCVRQGTGLSSHCGAGLPLPLQGPQQECGGPGMGGSSGICPRMLQDAALLGKSSCFGGQEPSSLGTSRAVGGTECPDVLPELPRGRELSQGWSTQWELSILPSLSLLAVPHSPARTSPLFPV